MRLMEKLKQTEFRLSAHRKFRKRNFAQSIIRMDPRRPLPLTRTKLCDETGTCPRILRTLSPLSAVTIPIIKAHTSGRIPPPHKGGEAEGEDAEVMEGREEEAEEGVADGIITKTDAHSVNLVKRG